MLKLNKDELNSLEHGRDLVSSDRVAQPLDVPSPVNESYESWADEQLFEEYRETDNQSLFATLVKRYERELYNYLRRFLADAVMAEDVFQATFFQVHVKRDLFESGRKFRPWLYTIATNQAIDAQRRNRRHRRLSLDQSYNQGADVQSHESTGSLLDVVVGRETDPALTCEQLEHSQWVREAVTGLPESLQKAVRLVYFRGMKYRDAAKVMSIPVGTVKSRLLSAIRSLGHSWENRHAAGNP